MSAAGRRLPVVFGAAMLLFSGCGGDVDSNKAEEEIKKGLTAQTKGDVKYVKCPEGVNAQKGATFKCEALIPVTVTQVDENGSIRWQITSFSGPPAGATGATGTTAPAGATGLGATGPTLTAPPRGGAPGDETGFVTYRNRSQGYSISYIARWQKAGKGRDVRFTNPNGVLFLHVVVHDAKGLPSLTEYRKTLEAQAGVTGVQSLTRSRINGEQAIAARFSYRQPGVGTRRVIKRYILARANKRVVFEIGQAPNLVDNTPLQKRFDRMANSFRWLGSGT